MIGICADAHLLCRTESLNCHMAESGVFVEGRYSTEPIVEKEDL